MGSYRIEFKRSEVFARAHAVTIRERDTMEQVRVPIAGLVAALRERLEAGD
jgi:glycyl-tRNA synthetase (class II)